MASVKIAWNPILLLYLHSIWVFVLSFFFVIATLYVTAVVANLSEGFQRNFVLFKNTRLSRLPLLNLFQIEALKGSSHLQTLMSYEILCVSLIPGRLYVWKCWQVGDFQLLHWNQRGIIGQPDKVLRNQLQNHVLLRSPIGQPCKSPLWHCLQERQGASQLKVCQHLRVWNSPPCWAIAAIHSEMWQVASCTKFWVLTAREVPASCVRNQIETNIGGRTTTTGSFRTASSTIYVGNRPHRSRFQTKQLAVSQLCICVGQSMTKIFEYLTILGTNIYSDNGLYQFFHTNALGHSFLQFSIQIFIRTFVSVKFWYSFLSKFLRMSTMVPGVTVQGTQGHYFVDPLVWPLFRVSSLFVEKSMWLASEQILL